MLKCRNCGQTDYFTFDYSGYYWDAVIPSGDMAGEPLACPQCHNATRLRDEEAQ